MFPALANRLSLVCAEPDIREISSRADLIFLALPHTVSMDLVPKFLKNGKKVIDLSADYRLKSTAVYEHYYRTTHTDKANLKKAIYGLPELYRYKIKDARLVANPGCYPTAAVLALAPAVACGFVDFGSIIIDAKSGVSGAGRKLAEDFLFVEAHENFKAYKIGLHQHTPEINQVLSKLGGSRIRVTFVPHLLPVNRGILETVYLVKRPDTRLRRKSFLALYRAFYKNEPFVRIKDEGQYPALRDVVGTNFCDIGIWEDRGSVIVIAVIDNLLKGASGQAIQNMNIMYRFPEQLGLL
jgi:N-acetyl-gamma-glutamyl-phosphate reductase